MTLITSSQTPESKRIHLLMAIKPLIDDLRTRLNENGFLVEYEKASFITFKVSNRKSLQEPKITTYGRLEFPHSLKDGLYTLRVSLFDTKVSHNESLSFASFPKTPLVNIFEFPVFEKNAVLYRANIENIARVFLALRNFSSHSFVLDRKYYTNK